MASPLFLGCVTAALLLASGPAARAQSSPEPTPPHWQHGGLFLPEDGKNPSLPVNAPVSPPAAAPGAELPAAPEAPAPAAAPGPAHTAAPGPLASTPGALPALAVLAALGMGGLALGWLLWKRRDAG